MTDIFTTKIKDKELVIQPSPEGKRKEDVWSTTVKTETDHSIIKSDFEWQELDFWRRK